MTDGEYKIVKFYSQFKSPVTQDISNSVIDDFADWSEYNLAFSTAVHNRWLTGGYGLETGITEKGTAELSKHETAIAREKEIAEMNFMKLKFDVKTSERIVKTYRTTRIFAWVGAISGIILLILELGVWLNWWSRS